MGLPIAACVVGLLVLRWRMFTGFLYLNSFQTFVEEMSEPRCYAFLSRGGAVTNAGELHRRWTGGLYPLLPHLQAARSPGEIDQACVRWSTGTAPVQLWEVR